MTFNLNRHFFVFPRELDRKKDNKKSLLKKVLVRDEFEWDNNELGKVMGSFRKQGFLLGYNFQAKCKKRLFSVF